LPFCTPKLLILHVLCQFVKLSEKTKQEVAKIAGKQIDLAGLGRITLVPVNIKEKEYETVDTAGNPVERRVEVKGKTAYVNCEGAAVPSGQICKKFLIDGEEIVAPKMKPTKTVDSEDIQVVDDNSDIYNAIDRKVYNVFTDSKKVKELVLEQGKTVEFPFVSGLGWKVYKAVLTRWQDKIVLVGCRGNINKALDVFSDEVVDLEMEAAPQMETAKKLLKAVAYC